MIILQNIQSFIMCCFFSYVLYEGEVYVNSATLAPGTETLTFDVTDKCGNTAQMSITITILNEVRFVLFTNSMCMLCVLSQSRS